MIKLIDLGRDLSRPQPDGTATQHPYKGNRSWGVGRWTSIGFQASAGPLSVSSPVVTDDPPEENPPNARETSRLDRGSESVEQPEIEVSPALALACVQTLAAEHLAVHQAGDRGEKMLRVVEKQEADLAGIHDGIVDPLAVVSRHVDVLDEADRIAFFVEAYFLDPFAPYALKTSQRQRTKTLRLLVEQVGQDPKLIQKIEKTASSAKSAYRQISWLRVGLLGAGSAAVFGLGGFLVAPIVGTALGGAAGLAGAAATNFGLALLGGGALAAGGAGMAGGMWLVAGTGAALGIAAGAGGGALFQLGAARARLELVKLQVTFKLTTIDTQVGHLKAQEVLKRMNGELDEMRDLVEQERTMNDENSKRIKDLEETLEALESAVAWMEHQVPA